MTREATTKQTGLSKNRSAGVPACKVLRQAAGETPALQEMTALRTGHHERGYLPHLKVDGGTYFVTFRLADSLPRVVLDRLLAEREEIVRRAMAADRPLSRMEQDELAALHSDRIESYLDSGHGKCWLREPCIGELVAKALRHFDGERYLLSAWVVMPNHVHAVVTPLGEHTLSAILQSWKSFAAHEVPRVAKTAGLSIPKGTVFWQRESYDRLIRDDAELARRYTYTIENPVLAGFCSAPEQWPYSSAGVLACKILRQAAGETPALQETPAVPAPKQ